MASYPPYDASAYQQPAAYPPPAADPNAYYAAAPPPAYGAPPPAYGYQPHPDEVRTLFLTGLPEDVKERELNNVLRFLPAYEVRMLGSGTARNIRVPSGHLKILHQHARPAPCC